MMLDEQYAKQLVVNVVSQAFQQRVYFEFILEVTPSFKYDVLLSISQVFDRHQIILT